MIHLAVQFLETTAETRSAIRAHVERDLRYLVVDEYQDVNPLQERLIRGLTQFGANLCVVGDDDQTIYQWRGSEVSNIVTFADRYDGVRRSLWPTTSDPRGDRGSRPVRRRVDPRWPAVAKEMAASGTSSGSAATSLRSNSPTGGRGHLDLRPYRGSARRRVPGHSTVTEPRGLSWSDCAVLFRSVAADAGPLVEEMRTPRHPASSSRASTGCSTRQRSKRWSESSTTCRTRSTPSDLARSCGMRRPSAGRRRLDCGYARLDTGPDFGRGARWGVYNIQRVYLDCPRSARRCARRRCPAPGPPRAGVLSARKVQPGHLRLRADLLRSDAAQKYETFAGWLQHQAPRVLRGCRCRRRLRHSRCGHDLHRPPSQGHAVAGRVRAVPAAEPVPRQGATAASTSSTSSQPRRSPTRTDTRTARGRDEPLLRRSDTRAEVPRHDLLASGVQPAVPEAITVLRPCAAANQRVSTREGPRPEATLEPRPRHETPEVTLSFSELKYLFECPYQFKMRFLYGFNAPLHEALGYGKGLARRPGGGPQTSHRRRRTGRHLRRPSWSSVTSSHHSRTQSCAGPLERAAEEAIERYFTVHGDEIARTVHSEKQIQVHVAPGITVDGRIDLIRRLDTDEVSIVDFKSTDRAQAEDVTRDQLHVYAVGYEELTGETADIIEVLNLDKEGQEHARGGRAAPLDRRAGADPPGRRVAAAERTPQASDLVLALRPVRHGRPVPRSARSPRRHFCLEFDVAFRVGPIPSGLDCLLRGITGLAIVARSAGGVGHGRRARGLQGDREGVGADAAGPTSEPLPVHVGDPGSRGSGGRCW